MPFELSTRKRRPPRVVLDSGIVIAALMFGGGTAAGLRAAWQDGRCRPMICKATLLDLQQRMAHPRLGFSAAERSALLGEFLPHALKVRVPDAEGIPGRADPAGMAFVRLAMAGRAHVLVTADPDLLGLAERFICPVMSLDDFVEGLARLPIVPVPMRPRIALAA